MNGFKKKKGKEGGLLNVGLYGAYPTAKQQTTGVWRSFSSVLVTRMGHFSARHGSRSMGIFFLGNFCLRNEPMSEKNLHKK
jgi:hypothetical protein